MMDGNKHPVQFRKEEWKTTGGKFSYRFRLTDVKTGEILMLRRCPAEKYATGLDGVFDDAIKLGFKVVFSERGEKRP